MAPVFWCREASADILPIVVPAHLVPEGALKVDRLASHCRVDVLAMPDGVRHFLFSDAGRRLQVMVRAVAEVGADGVLTDACIELGRLERRLLSIRRLSHLVERQSLPSALFPADPRGRRLRMVLQALDGALAGASHRDIGSALFGHDRILADWGDPRRHLPDQVRRAVRRGRFLMQKGYLGLLK